jgi:hypothetical protein
MPSSTKTPQDRRPKKSTKKADANPGAQPIPVPTDPTSKYAPNTWLAGGIGSTEELRTPSGQLCLVMRPGMEGLMKAGVLHNVDTLSQVVNAKHLKRVAGKADEINVSSLMDDPDALDEVTHVVDKIVCHCVVQPQVFMTPNDVTRREAGVVYADMVDLVDKMFIFQYVVGGTRDLETFRGGLSVPVGSVEDGASVPVSSE